MKDTFFYRNFLLSCHITWRTIILTWSLEKFFRKSSRAA